MLCTQPVIADRRPHQGHALLELPWALIRLVPDWGSARVAALHCHQVKVPTLLPEDRGIITIMPLSFV